MAHGLERDGLILRVASPDDKRVLHVKLTDKGLKRIKTIRPEYRLWVQNNVTCHFDDNEVKIVTDALIRLALTNGAIFPEKIDSKK